MDRAAGDNAHLSYLNDKNWQTAVSRWQINKPGVVLLLDSFGDKNPEAQAKYTARVFEAEQRCPYTVIISRTYIENPNGGLDNHWSFLTPEAWVEKHRRFANTRIYCSADNEPNFLKSLPWLLRVAQLAREARIKVALGGFNV